MQNITTFQQYLLSAFTQGPCATEEAIAFVLPLFEEVASFHDEGMVGSFEKPDTVFITDGRLDIDESYTHLPKQNIHVVNELLQKQQLTGFTITESLLVEEDVNSGTMDVNSAQVQLNPNDAIEMPVYLPGYQCFELKVNHHDAQTDIFCLGLILGSVVMGLDLYDAEDLKKFVQYRNQPAGLNNRMHPTICALITEMTELQRSRRSRDLNEIVQRLKNYRDYDPQRVADLGKLANVQVSKTADRNQYILGKLRNRLFDTSRRNRLLFYKPNSRFVNLTVSSVPMVVQFQSIQPEMLFTWNDEVSKEIIAQHDISLNKYLRFEDHPYLNSQLNSIRLMADNDVKEYGFSQLKLVVAFLHWHNLKEDINERIQSPLLLLPVELKKTKALKEEKLTLKIVDNAALVNPVLSNYLKDLYGIRLPDSIDFDDVSMRQFFELLKSQIDAAKQSVTLNYIDKPRVRLIHNIARQTVNNYRKKLKAANGSNFRHVEYSYSEDNYKPLGLELFRQKVEPGKSQLDFLLEDAKPYKSKNQFAAEAATKEKTTFSLTDGDSNPYSWDFDICNIVLGNFNYKKMSLVGDYNTVAEQEITHPVFQELFSNEPRRYEEEKYNYSHSEWYHVITADPTQTKAILHNRSGKSYVIQGPPGTGKSQTITNLIADFLAQGKSILFVCEKRAALDVVHDRLKKNHLSELCSYIHDSQADKKKFVLDLKDTYEDFLKNKMDLSTIRLHRKLAVERMEEQLQLLYEFHQQNQQVYDAAGIDTHQLIEKLIALKHHLPELDAKQQDAMPAYNHWLSYGDTIKQLSKALEESGAEGNLHEHPFGNLGKAVIQSDSPFTLFDSLMQKAQATIEQIKQVVQQNNIPAHHVSHLANIKNLVQDAVILEPLAKSHNLALVDAANPEAKKFDKEYRDYKQLQQAAKQATDANSNWQSRFSKSEVSQALDIASKHENSFFKFLSGDWRRLKKQLQSAYNFSAHHLTPSYSSVLQQLQKEYDAIDTLQHSLQSMQQQYQVESIDNVYVGIDVLRRKRGDAEIDYLLQHTKPDELVLQLGKLNNVLHQLALQLQQCLYNYQEKSISQIEDELATIASNAELLQDLLPALKGFAKLPETLQQALRNMPLSPLQTEAAMAQKALQLVYKQAPVFAQTNHQALQQAVQEIEKSYTQLLQLNSDFIRATLRENFLQRYELSNTSVTQLDNAQRELKKQYTEGRKILEREMSKTKSYKSIREMASLESGMVLKDIKPVWLMSPLSVSDSLPISGDFFDVVIFDEASQITLEEGVPALFRAPQCIIVGDDKQMPPTNFFNAKAEDPDDLESSDEEDDELLTAEADSLLVQGARKLSGTMLSWHYRSRYETLISYSNHAFYEAGLLTIPDKTIQHNDKPGIEIQQPEEGLQTAQHLLNTSISFHYLPNSLYESRSNNSEARYIAFMLKQLLIDNAKETIGIVAFSQEQQSVIEEAITVIAAGDKLFEELLEKAYNREDDGQFTGLFVKNLENVQGDERDIIIMSVCYGHDSRKKMLMNFGPINRKGGEKRLNVIFSRAKKHMAVVSSIKHHHITNDYNEGASYLKRFLHYAEMVSIGNMSLARTILDSLTISKQKDKQQQKNTVSATIADVKQQLEAKGYIVDEYVGQSSFKCSLAVKKKKDDAEYSLGILVDDDSHYSNDDVVEQYYQRPGILQSFGWQIMNVYAKDWLENSDKILQQLLKKLSAEKVAEVKEKPLPAPVSKPAPVIESSLQFTHLESAAEDKFWEIAQDGAKLHIRSGKLGSKGINQIKTYESEALAINEKERLIKEQVEKGYKRK